MVKPSKMGRPSKFKKEYIEAIIEFFDREPNHVVEIVDDEGKKTIATNKFGDAILVPCKLPTFEAFARSIGVHRETVLNWAEANPDFLDAIKRAKDIQKEILIQNGLLGAYDRTFAIFTAKCVTDMRENAPVQDDDDIRPVKVEIKVRDARKPQEIDDE
jgi:hypothetical protein